MIIEKPSVRLAPEWQTLSRTLPELSRIFREDPFAYSFQAYLKNIMSYKDWMLSGWEEGRPAVWYNVGLASILVKAFEPALNVCIESMPAMQNLVGDPRLTLEMIDAAEAHGVASDACSADKGGIGAILRGCYPPPTCHVGINTPCDSQAVAIQAMAELYPAPLFLIDVPYYYDQRAINHVSGQLRDLIAFLEKHIGYKMDYDRLKLTCERTNLMAGHIWEWLEWRKHVPEVQPSKICGMHYPLLIMFSGSDGGVEIAEGFAREARERAESGQRPFEEKARAIWYQDPIWFDMQIYDWMEAELGLSVPVDVFGYFANEGFIETTSEEKMLEGIARILVNSTPMSRQFRGNIERYVSDFMRLHEEFRADCGIWAGHIACKHAWGAIGLFKEACRKADIPLLIFPFDMFDPRISSYDEVYSQISHFVNEVVIPRKRKG